MGLPFLALMALDYPCLEARFGQVLEARFGQVLEAGFGQGLEAGSGRVPEKLLIPRIPRIGGCR